MPPTPPSDPAPVDARPQAPLRRRAPAAASASSAAADEALRQLVAGRRRTRSGAAPRRQSSPRFRFGGLRRRATPRVDRSGIVRWAPRVLAGVVSAGLLVTAAFVLAPSATRLHGVRGSVRVNDVPLPHCILEFQSQGPVATGRRFHTVIHPNADGTFRRDAAVGLPAGTYAVTVKPHTPAAGRARAPAIPAAYTQVASTPIRIEIRGPTEALELVVKQ